MSNSNISWATAAVAAMLLLASIDARADWRPIPSAADGTTQFYDPHSIVRTGSVRQLTFLNENPKPEFVKVRKISKLWISQIIHAEYNCQSQEYQIIENTLFAGSMGSGESFKSSGVSKWRDLSDGFAMWRTSFGIACGS